MKQQGLLGNAEVGAAMVEGRAPLEIRWTCLRRAQATRTRLIRQVYEEVDPLMCARYGGTMRVIAVIERQTVVRQILEH